MAHFFLLLAALLVFSGCSTTSEITSGDLKVKRLTFGMSQAQVLEIMGEPDRKDPIEPESLIHPKPKKDEYEYKLGLASDDGPPEEEEWLYSVDGTYCFLDFRHQRLAERPRCQSELERENLDQDAKFREKQAKQKVFEEPRH